MGQPVTVTASFGPALYRCRFCASSLRLPVLGQLRTAASFGPAPYRCQFRASFVPLPVSGQLCTAASFWSAVYRCWFWASCVPLLILGQLYTAASFGPALYCSQFRTSSAPQSVPGQLCTALASIQHRSQSQLWPLNCRATSLMMDRSLPHTWLQDHAVLTRGHSLGFRKMQFSREKTRYTALTEERDVPVYSYLCY